MAKANSVFNPQGKNVIVSIDGGGIKGVTVAAMLSFLEKELQKEDKSAKFGDYIDFVAGTSTGGIIASGLAIGLPAQQILDIYLNRLPSAFGKNGVTKWLRYILSGTKYIYPITPFLPILNEVAGDLKVSEIPKNITLFMVVTDIESELPTYVVSQGPGSKFTDDWPLSEAILATSSAPVYFQPTHRFLIDGGVSFNNPSYMATVEAMNYLGEAQGFVEGNVIHMSFGTGYISNSIKDASTFGIINWVPFLISKFMGDQNDAQAVNTQREFGEKIDFRRYNPNLHAFGGSHLKLDSTSAPDLELMRLIGLKYAESIDWSKESVMPWGTPPYGAPQQKPIRRRWDGKRLV